MQAAAPHYGVYDFAGATGTRRPRSCADRFLGPRVLFKDPRSELDDVRAGLAAAAGATPTRRRSSWSTAAATPWSRSTRRGRSSTRCAACRKQPVAYAELPGAQHAFDVFPSIRCAHVVRGVDRFLRFSYDAWVNDGSPSRRPVERPVEGPAGASNDRSRTPEQDAA